jgi:hypothetical protein
VIKFYDEGRQIFQEKSIAAKEKNPQPAKKQHKKFIARPVFVHTAKKVILGGGFRIK